MRKNFAEYLAVAALAAAPVAAQEPGDLFTKLDANKDGYVTPDEVQEGQKALYERLLRTSDKDGDKKLSKEEFQAGLKPEEGPRPPLPGGQFPGPRGDKGGGDPREFFNRMDANKDGKLSKDEMPERMREGFARLDSNGDGAVSPEEFAQAGRQFSKGPPGGQPGRPNPDGVPNRGEYEALFDRTDSNSDGKLTKNEIPEERQGMRAILERSGEESITKEQFVRGMLAMSQFGGQPPRPEGGPRPEGAPRPDGAPRPEGARPDGPRPDGPRPDGARPGGPRPEGTPFRRPDGAPGGPGGGLFSALDTDRNGELSTSEIVAAGSSLLKLDRNNDGKLTPDEVFAGVGGPPAGAMRGRPGDGRPGEGRPGDGRPGEGRPGEGRPGVGQPGNGLPPGGPPEGRRPGQRGFGGQNVEEFRQRLKDADTNGDGKLSKDEAPALIKERFDRIDSNSDGFIDDAEMQQMGRVMSQGGDQKSRRPKND